ncbi:MAG: hypothetical protein CM1200mP2_31990 [Planctomycetaceae bacterium]|nr:MAG: hypothetical protein CM1200mP2_31990 [Planctomycetaceae bacterium]
MIQVQLPDGTLQEHPDEATALDVAAGIGERLAGATMAAEIDGMVVDAMRPLKQLTDADPVPLKLLTNRDPEALGVMRHSCAHVMARAVMRLFPGVGLAFGPTVANGYYYDFELDEPIREDDFERIEQEMRAIVKEAEPFERFHLDRDEAIEFCGELGQELKVEHIETGLSEHPDLSFYRQGEFVDLCRGPHVPDAGRIKAFKVLSVAGSHWKGDASKAVDCSVSTARRGSARRSRRHISNGSRRRVAVITACWASSTGCSRSPRRSGGGCVCGCPRAPV